MQNRKINKTCDKAIIELSKGDKNALSIIYDCMARMIFTVAYTIVNNYQDAEDVLQDTLIEITKYAHAYQKGSNAKAWILTMTRHLSIDIVRKRKSTLCIDDIEINEPSMLTENPEILSLEVFDMLNRLDEDERQIIIFRIYSQMPYKKISQIMNITIASAQKKYQRTIKKLKTEYL